MGAAQLKSHKDASEAMKWQAQIPFGDFYRSDVFWAPYRAMSRMLLQSQRSATAMLEVNRKFVDEMRDVFRREQDAIDDASGRMLQKLSDGGEPSADAGAAVSQFLTELYESSVENVREFGKVMNEAQARSVEIMGENGKAIVEASQVPSESKPSQARREETKPKA